jgi:hypothetical protein
VNGVLSITIPKVPGEQHETPVVPIQIRSDTEPAPAPAT